MGQTLDNGIYLPSEGERNCYEGLAGNWVALDNHLGSTNIHVTINDKQAWDGHVADSVKHVTAEDKAAWNGKADASALTAHTGDTTIHVTAADKQTWNGKQDALSQTQLDAVNSGIDSTKVQQIATNTSDISSLQSGKANDSNVVHKSGNETISGQKLFSDINAISSSAEIGVSGGNNSFKILDKNKKILARIEGGTFSTGMAYSYWLVNNGANAFNGVSLYQASANLAQLRPYNSTFSVQLGASNRYFTDCYTSKVNGLEPSSLSLPSGKVSDVIDISSYLVNLDGTDNTYVAPSNGWITINMNNCSGIHATITGFWGDSRIRASAGAIKFLMPVLKNQTVTLTIHGGTINSARFIPCQGNV